MGDAYCRRGTDRGEIAEGTPIKIKTQVGDKLIRMLISVNRAAEAGNMVLSNVDKIALRELIRKEGQVDPTVIVNRKSGTKSETLEENWLCTYSIWAQRRVAK